MHHSLQEGLLNTAGISITYGCETSKLSQKHTHDYDEIVIIIGGSGNQHINNESYFVSTGDVFIVKGDAVHYFSDANNLQIFNIGFKPWVLSNFSQLLFKTPGYHSLFVLEPAGRKQARFSQKLHLDMSSLKVLSDMLEQLKNELNNQKDELMVTALFMQITGFICRMHYNYSYSKIAKDNPCAKILEYIETHYTEQITLENLCEISLMSKNGIIAMFRRLYGITPIKYINNLRINKAEMLLKNTSVPITSLALECGFGDSNYFTKYFKIVKGITPREYRINSQIIKY